MQSKNNYIILFLSMQNIQFLIKLGIFILNLLDTIILKVSWSKFEQLINVR